MMSSCINNALNYLRLQYVRLYYRSRNKSLAKIHRLPKLTRNELNIIHKTWPCFRLKNSDLVYLRMYKQEKGFDPYFLDEYQIRQVYEKTNLPLSVYALENKGLVDVYFEKMPFPKVYIRYISNVLYNSNMKPITKADAIELLSQNTEFVIKPSSGTARGNGVKKVLQSTKEELDNLIVTYTRGGDFVVQESLKQHKEIEKLNPSSLNTCRVTSIYLNGKFANSAMLKIGKHGAIKDNWNSSYLVGIDSDGILHNCGYDNKLNKIITTDNGITFGGMQYPCFYKMIDFVRDNHKRYFPNCGVVGWDIFIDDCEQVKLVEVNLSNNGVVGEQLCSGTFFKEYCEDICNLLNINQKN